MVSNSHNGDTEVRLLVKQFSEAAVAYGIAIANRDSAAVNASAATLARTYKRLKLVGPTALVQLCDDPRSIVALSAATYSLGIDSKRSYATLEKLASEPGEIGFEARQCMQRWDEKTWRIDDEVEMISYVKPHQVFKEVKGDVLAIARGLPARFPSAQITSRQDLDARIGMVNVFFVNMIGVADGFLDFCPDNDPPTDDDVLAFLWVVRPELAKQIAERLHNRAFAEQIVR